MPNSPPLVKLGVGYLRCPTLARDALTYLLLYQNGIQNLFQFSVLDLQGDLPSNHVSHDEYLNCAARAVKATIEKAVETWKQSQWIHIDFPQRWLIITEQRLPANWYLYGRGDFTILSLADWDKRFAPPSALEFVLRAAQMTCLRYLRSTATHFETRGCLFDFNARIADARNMALIGVLCPECRASVVSEAGQGVLDEFGKLTNRAWLGSLSDPGSVAAILKKAFGYNIYITRALSPGWREIVWSNITTSGPAAIITGIIGLLFGILGTWLSLRLKLIPSPKIGPSP